MDTTDPEAIEDAYARHCQDLKRYLAFDVALLASLEANHDDSRADQVAKKKKMLVRYQELWEVETSIPLSGPCVIMGGLFLNNVLLGSLLGISNVSLWVNGLVSLLFELQSGLSRLSGKIDSMFEEEENTLVEENAVVESSGGMAGESSTTAVELTELDTRRRTATGLLEEGRPPAGG